MRTSNRYKATLYSIVANMIATPLRRAKALSTLSVKPAELPRVYPAFLETVTETSDSPPVSPNKICLELLDDPDILLPNPDLQEVLETRNIRQSYSSTDCSDTTSDTRQKHCTQCTWSICLSTHMSIYLSVALCVCLSVCLSFSVCLRVCVPMCLSVCLRHGCVSVYRSVWTRSVSQSVGKSVSLSVGRSVSLSMCLFDRCVLLSVSIYLSLAAESALATKHPMAWLTCTLLLLTSANS